MPVFNMTIADKYPARSAQITQLSALYGEPSDPTPSSLIVSGQSGTGKTSIVKDFFESEHFAVAIVNCVECYSLRLLLEPVLQQLNISRLPKNFRCENFMDFIHFLKSTAENRQFREERQIIILDGAEELTDGLYLQSFCRLQELTEIYTLGVVFICAIVPEKFNIVSRCITIHFPQYSKDDIVEILKQQKPMGSDQELFDRYINSAVGVFLRTTRDLSEMKNLILTNFDKYCEPIRKGELNENDVAALWRLIVPHLRSSLQSTYLGIADTDETKGFHQDEKHLVSDKALDLPYYAKFLLIASYLASYNSPKHDRRLFLRNHGKQKKRATKRILKDKITAELIGPKAYSLDRLLAIFYSIMEEKASVTVNLMCQIATLVELRLIAKIGDGVLNKPKFKCLAGFSCVESLSKTLGFDLKKYLLD